MASDTEATPQSLKETVNIAFDWALHNKKAYEVENLEFLRARINHIRFVARPYAGRRDQYSSTRFYLVDDRV